MLLFVIITTISVSQYNLLWNVLTAMVSIDCPIVKFFCSGLSEFEVLATDGNGDMSSTRNLTINMTSVNFYEQKQLSTAISITLSPCHSGYIFDSNSQQCKCYDRDQDVIQCQQDYAEIKYGYWFGSLSSTLRT